MEPTQLYIQGHRLMNDVISKKIVEMFKEASPFTSIHYDPFREYHKVDSAFLDTLVHALLLLTEQLREEK